MPTYAVLERSRRNPRPAPVWGLSRRITHRSSSCFGVPVDLVDDEGDDIVYDLDDRVDLAYSQGDIVTAEEVWRDSWLKVEVPWLGGTTKAL